MDPLILYIYTHIYI